jgi:HEAT repeat protein
MKSIAAAIGLAALVAIASGATPIAQQATNTLTPIDTVPTRQQLDNAFSSPTNALDNLTALATDADSDAGVRLRAIHALAKYCASSPCVDSDVAHQSLTTVILDNRNETSGFPLLLLRAATETIGTMRVSSDLALLQPLLNHPSRDIRAATARALQDLCNSNAVAPLRIRYTQEGTEQVKLAISEALRVLEQCSSN